MLSVAIGKRRSRLQHAYFLYVNFTKVYTGRTVFLTFPKIIHVVASEYFVGSCVVQTLPPVPPISTGTKLVLKASYPTCRCLSVSVERVALVGVRVGVVKIVRRSSSRGSTASPAFSRGVILSYVSFRVGPSSLK